MQKSAKVMKQTPKEVSKPKRQRASSPDPAPTKKSRTKSADKSKPNSASTAPKRSKAGSANSQPTEFGSVGKNRPIVKAESTKKSPATSPKKSKSKDKKVEQFSVESILEPIKPKRPRNGYIFFVKSYFSNVEIPSVEDAQNHIRAAAQAWNLMTERERKPFLDAQEKDRQRFKREMGEFERKGYFTNSDGVRSTDLAFTNRQFQSHVELPKRRLIAKNAFIKEQFQIKRNSLGEDNMPRKVLAALAHDWTDLSEKMKAKYKQQALADQTRYDRQMQELLTQGYFVREDGTRSHNKPIKDVQMKIDGANAKNVLVKKEETDKGKSTASVGSKRPKEHAEPKAASKRLKK